MRSKPGGGGGRRRARGSDAATSWPLGDARVADGHMPADEPLADPDEETSQRITLIEFTWTGRVGTQPVIFVSREWLQ